MSEPFNFPELDSQTRALMLQEIDRDAAAPYLSDRLTPKGRESFPELIRLAAATGTEQELVSELDAHGLVAESAPRNAGELFGSSEFNRFYIRAICLRANAHGSNDVLIIRARPSKNPRPQSDARVGERMAAQTVLDDLRLHTGVGTALGVPEVNSGLSVRCGCSSCLAAFP
jgi:hypothetical protein